MAYSARPLSTDTLYNLVTQTAHGFQIGQCVTLQTGTWVLAKADNIVDAFSTMMVTLVPTANTFYVTQTGYVFNMAASSGAPFTPGEPYFLSTSTAGQLTLTFPTLAGDVLLPCFLPDTATSGYFYGGSGTLVINPTAKQWLVVTTDTNMLPNVGYFALVSSPNNLNLTIPVTFNMGDEIQVALIGTGTVTVKQNAGQRIFVGNGAGTTTGTGGSILFGSQGFVDLIAVSGNSSFYSKPTFGNVLVT